MLSALEIFDSLFTELINENAGYSRYADVLAVFCATTLLYIVVVFVSAYWISRTDQKLNRFKAASCGLASLLALSTSVLISGIFERARPYDAKVTKLLVSASTDPSFPSDHASITFAIALTLFALKDRYRWLALIAATAIGLARVFVGIHYVGDILGGIVVAALATSIIQVAYRPTSHINNILLRFP